MSRAKTFEMMRPEQASSPPAKRPDPPGVVYGCTDAGVVRINNEDQFLVATLEKSVLLEQSGFPLKDGTRLSESPKSRLFMVADGMGGHEGGDIASAVAVDAIAHYVFTAMPWVSPVAATADRDAVIDGLRAAVRRAQDRMLEVAARKNIDSRLGSTLTLAYVAWPSLLLFHVGDSRAYLFRDGELNQLTRDHNLAEQMVQGHVMTEQEARESHFTSVLTNALGGGSADLHVELHTLQLKPEDTIVLCTDGLHGEVSDEQIAACLTRNKSKSAVQAAAHELVEQAKSNGGRDNVTVVVAAF